MIEPMVNTSDLTPEHGRSALNEERLSIKAADGKENDSMHASSGRAATSSPSLASPSGFQRFSISIRRQFIGHLKSVDLTRLARRLFVAALAACVLIACRWFAYQLRFDFEIPTEYQTQLHGHLPWVTCLELVWLLLFRQFSGIYRYFSLEEARYLVYATALSGISLYAVRYFDLGFAPPRGKAV
jgi:hypothetical protein